MNKFQFIEKLRSGLAGRLSSGTVAELTADFEAHFDEAVRAGQNEEEVCRVLGDPMEIAAQCIDEYGETVPAAEPLREANPIESTRIEASGSSGVNTLCVKLLSYNLVCNPCNREKFNIDIRRSGQSVEDDTISIQECNGRLEIVQSTDYRSIIGFAFRALEDKTIVVDVPVSFGGAYEIDVASGNCRLEHLSPCTGITCEVKSGNIHLEKLCWEIKLEAISLSGNIKLNDCQGSAVVRCTSGNVKLEGCKGRCEAESRSGNVRIKEHSGYAAGSTFSGNVEIITDELLEDAEYHVKSGNIHVTVDRLAADVNLNCTSGNVHIDVKKLEGNITAKTLSGNAIATLPYGTKANFDLKSNVTKHKQYSTATSGDGSVPIVTMSSISGNAKVRES